MVRCLYSLLFPHPFTPSADSFSPLLSHLYLNSFNLSHIPPPYPLFTHIYSSISESFHSLSLCLSNLLRCTRDSKPSISISLLIFVSLSPGTGRIVAGNTVAARSSISAHFHYIICLSTLSWRVKGREFMFIIYLKQRVSFSLQLLQPTHLQVYKFYRNLDILTCLSYNTKL